MVPQVDTNWLFDLVLPALPKEIEMDKVLASLRESNAIEGSGTWTAFSVDPKRESRHEDVVFSQLEPIFDAIMRAIKQLYPSLKQNFTLLLKPKTPPKSERGCSSRPDNCFVPVNVAERIKAEPSGYFEWYELTVPAEDKKVGEDSIEATNDNISKIVYSLQQIMALDPCRRFTFGLTMQNRQLRVWFACRGVVLTTKPCDFFTDHRRVAHLFISLAFSDRTALGWDPTIECIKAPDLSKSRFGKRQYKVKFGDQAFTTVDTLADYAAESTVSRATRVWLVRDETGKKYVLKDVWLDLDRSTEHEIREAMLKDVESKCGKSDLEMLKRHILTPHCFEQVLVNNVLDSTDRMMNHQVPPTSDPFPLRTRRPTNPERQSHHPSRSNTDGLSSGILSTDAADNHTFEGSGSNEEDDEDETEKSNDNPGDIVIRQKYHYRIVFQEYGSTLYQEKNMLNIYIVLTDLLAALDIIHRSGWVHRDISCGNVYCFQDTPQSSPRGMLGDFEYAKCTTATQEHELRTGTPDFMAVEAIARIYCFLPAEALLGDVSNPPSPIDFSHNALHDLESSWWLLVYILFNNDDAAHILKHPKRHRVRNQKNKSLFNHSPGTVSRLFFLKYPTEMDVKNTGISSSLQPVLQTLSNMAKYLLLSYEKAEKPFSSLDNQAFFIHKTLASFLEGTHREAIRGIRLQGLRSSGEKRKALETGDDSNASERKSKRSRTHTSDISP